MQAFLQRCLNRIAIAIFTLVLLPVTVQAGPTVHSAAESDFQDPLSSSRPRAPSVDPFVRPNRDIGSDTVRIPLEPDIAAIDNDGQVGLDEVQTDEIARTVRDEFLGLGRPTNAQGSGASLDAVADQPDGSSASIVRALVNSVPAGPAGNAADQNSQNANSSTRTLLDATLDNLIVTILNPDLTTEGMVTFSIAGFGEFALLLLQESGGIFLVDMETGTAVKFSEGGTTQLNGTIAGNREGPGQQDRAPSNALQRVLEILERNVLPIITSPITLAAVVLFSIIWVVWRLSNRA